MTEKQPTQPLLSWPASAALEAGVARRVASAAEAAPTAARTAAAGNVEVAPRSAFDLGFVLTSRAGRRVDVRFGRSRTLPVQLSRIGDRYRLRLHAFFATAPDDVIRALSIWVAHGRRDRDALAHLDAWIDQALDRLPARTKRATAPRPHGTVHDLLALSQQVRAGGWLDDLSHQPGIGWGQRPGRAHVSLQLGLYDPDVDQVRIHPVLDDTSVPAWFVCSVLFHELLHAAIPPRRDGAGRWVKHGPEFRRRERAHPDHARAQAWLAAHISRLIVAARRLRRQQR